MGTVQHNYDETERNGRISVSLLDIFQHVNNGVRI
jgi:hypothetical protein